MKSNKTLKYIGIVIFCSILDMCLHILTSKVTPIPEDSKFSLLVKTISAPGAAILWIFLAFSTAAYIFYRYEAKIPGKRRSRGLRYGGAIALLWLWGMLWGVPVYGNTILHEVVTGICDAVPVTLMGLLLGGLSGERNLVFEKEEDSSPISGLLSLVIFSLIFLIGRYFLYSTEIVESGYTARPVLTFIWTLLMGTCTGIVYILLGHAAQASARLSRAAGFGIIIFGINWVIFAIFIPFLFSGTLFEALLLSAGDIISVLISCLLTEVLAEQLVKGRKKTLKITGR